MRISTRNTRSPKTLAATAVITICASQVLAAGPSAAAAPLACKAHMSSYHPRDYSTIDVYVHTKAHAKVRTTASYKTTSTTHTGKADRTGRAAIEYRISDATPGYKVHLSVTVRKQGRSGSCSTWFTPKS
jgi:hypothetical protein